MTTPRGWRVSKTVCRFCGGTEALVKFGPRANAAVCKLCRDKRKPKPAAQKPAAPRG